MIDLTVFLFACFHVNGLRKIYGTLFIISFEILSEIYSKPSKNL